MPQTSDSSFWTPRSGVSAMMRCSGLKLERRRAISPDAVMTAMVRASISSPAKTAASHSARLTRPDWRPAKRVIASCVEAAARPAESMMRHRRHREDGYCPSAVRREHQSSLPSQTAFATSDASARVGRGSEIMDWSICVAVMTTRSFLFAASMMRFW